jgi:hypothetical protein
MFLQKQKISATSPMLQHGVEPLLNLSILPDRRLSGSLMINLTVPKPGTE